jgi:hypothetical protein
MEEQKPHWGRNIIDGTSSASDMSLAMMSMLFWIRNWFEK